MFGVIFDTNIYGRIFEDKESGAELIEKIKTSPSFKIHNFKLIRNELRGAPKILPLYDGLVSNRIIEENNEIKTFNIDIIETFNYIAGIFVDKIIKKQSNSVDYIIVNGKREVMLSLNPISFFPELPHLGFGLRGS